jgi:hypothetical protein
MQDSQLRELLALRDQAFEGRRKQLFADAAFVAALEPKSQSNDWLFAFTARVLDQVAKISIKLCAGARTLRSALLPKEESNSSRAARARGDPALCLWRKTTSKKSAVTRALPISGRTAHTKPP